MPTYLKNAEALRDVLADLGGVGKAWNGAKAILWTNAPPFVATTTTPYADLTVPTFTGYAESAAIVWRDPYYGADGNLHLTGPSVQFEATAAVIPGQAAYGAAIVGDPSGVPFLIEIIVFDAAVIFTHAHDGVVVDIDVPVSPTF